MKSIRGKKALVTGAGSGIGRAIALALAQEGADVCLLGRGVTKLEATAAAVKAYGVDAVILACDLSQPAQITAAVNDLLARWRLLDILVNNAGLAYYGPMGSMTAAEWTQILAVDLLAPIQLVRELLPTLQAREEAHVVNVSSIFGLVQARKLAAYQTGKFGLVGFSTALAAEFGSRTFGVTALCPGFVRTPMLENYVGWQAGRDRRRVPSWASTSAEQVAAAAIRAIYANKAIVVMPWSAKLLWWATRIAPNGMAWLMRQGWRK
jgi:short-subunit dehydrogenase